MSTGQTVHCTLGQVPFIDDSDDYGHEKHFLNGKFANDAERESWRNLRVNAFNRLIIDVIDRKFVSTRVLSIVVMPKKDFPSILKEALSMAIAHFKEQGISVELDLQVFSPHFCSVAHGLSQEELTNDRLCCHAKSGDSTESRGLLSAVMESCLHNNGGQNEEPDQLHQEHECGV